MCEYSWFGFYVEHHDLLGDLCRSVVTGHSVFWGAGEIIQIVRLISVFSSEMRKLFCDVIKIDTFQI